MNNQWTPGAGPQQWGMPQTGSVSQPNQWQSIQQPSLMHQQLHQKLPQQTGYHGNPQYQPPQPIHQGAYIQEQLAQVREEQKARKFELQKRRMQTMNVAGAKPPPSIDSLIGLTDVSPSTKKRVPSNTRAHPVTTSATQPPSKPRAWTVDTSEFQGVFTLPPQQGDDSFGEFQSPPPVQPLGVGVVPTSSYTRPIPAVSSSPVVVHRDRSNSSPHMLRVQPRNSSHIDAGAFPPLYMEVYNRCLKDGALSTELLFPVLMSSQLPKQRLGELWQLANRGTPGKLLQTELFVLLGLIGLVQAGHPNPRFVDLQNAPAPPVPKLESMKKDPPTNFARPPPNATDDDFGSFQQGPLIRASTQATISVPRALSSTSSNTFSATPVLSLSDKATTSADKYGTFEAFKPSTNTGPLVPSPAVGEFSTRVSAPVGDKYGAFDMLKPTTGPPVSSASKDSPNQTLSGDKYGAFDVLRSTSDPADDFGDFKSGSLSSVSITDNIGGLELSTAGPSYSTTTLDEVKTFPPATGNSFGAFQKSQNQLPSDDFGSFVSVNVSTSSSDQSTTPSNTEGWADFSKPLQPLSTPSNTLSDLNPLIPPQQPSTSLPASSNPATVTPMSLVSLDTSEIHSQLEPQKKVVTGLDILNAEMEARLLSKESPQSLDTTPLVPESLDDFGEFSAFGRVKVNSVVRQENATDTKKPSTDPCDVWRKCLIKCEEVLEQCVDVFRGVEEPELKAEIAESEEGRNKLRGIVEVYRLAKRVYSALKEKESAVVNAPYTRAIKTHWNTLLTQLPNSVMAKLYSETTPQDNGETAVSDVLSDTISKCPLCLKGKRVDIPAINALDDQTEGYPLGLLFHNGQTYHAGCANFWINVVQEQLPVVAV